MPQKDGNSDSSYDIVSIPHPLRRHPRAPTTVQVVPDDFDAVTHDLDVVTEMYPLNETRMVREGHGRMEDGQSRFNGMYGIDEERQEGSYRQGSSTADYQRYMVEVSRRLQGIAIGQHPNGLNSATGLPVEPEPSQMKTAAKGERGERVHVWREEVARNGVDGSSAGGSMPQETTPTQHHRSQIYETESDLFRSRELQNDKPTTLGRRQSNASQTYQSERVYTSSELNAFWPLKAPQGIGVKQEKRIKSPSPTRSERIYTMAELNALTGQKSSPPRQTVLAGYKNPYNRSTNSNSPPKHFRSDFRTSSPVASRTRSASTTSVEMVLASCQPSLLHIAPVLYSLGIKQREHLRALARLREGTRDREMKEEMLKKGVTVLEWAILMDKLQGF